MFTRSKPGLRALALAPALLSVCAAQTLSPTPPQPALPEDGAAQVVTINGQVSVMKDSTPWALQLGETVGPGKLIVAGPDGYAIFQVADGSTFEVFPNSRVTFRANPGSWKDLVDVWLGRIKVHIQKWGGQPNNSRIHTPTAVISVRGTTFDVSVEDDESTAVAVEEGQVAVRHRIIPHDKPRLVNAGEQIRIYKDLPIARSILNKGAVAERGLNALAEAFYMILLRGPRVPGSAGGGVPVPAGGGAPPGGGPSLPGDTGGTPPPPPPGDTGSTPPPPPTP